jgi:methionyl-tRNA formyltransferase
MSAKVRLRQRRQSEADIVPVPIKAVAQKLGLTVHERDTFTGWQVSQKWIRTYMGANCSQLPRPRNESINLIIAVSFGLFVPPRILKSAEYGGLNVHPSLLPKYVSRSSYTSLLVLIPPIAFEVQLHFNTR